MNADAFVTAAKSWINVPKKVINSLQWLSIDYFFNINNYNDNHIVRIQYQYNNDGDAYIKYLEHVEIIVNIWYPIRGALTFYLQSPNNGMRIQLLGSRINDRSTNGFNDWHLMSVATWSENPNGLWILDIYDNVCVYKY